MVCMYIDGLLWIGWIVSSVSQAMFSNRLTWSQVTTVMHVPKLCLSYLINDTNDFLYLRPLFFYSFGVWVVNPTGTV
jgi:hypothetical protein